MDNFKREKKVFPISKVADSSHILFAIDLLVYPFLNIRMCQFFAFTKFTFIVGSFQAIFKRTLVL